MEKVLTTFLSHSVQLAHAPRVSHALCCCLQHQRRAGSVDAGNSASRNAALKRVPRDPACTRALSGETSSRYQVDYDSLKRPEIPAAGLEENPYIKTSVPETVSKNVKNVQGWRLGAERGFSAIYPDLIHVLSHEGQARWDNPDLGRWFVKVLTHNLSTNVVGKRFGILVPITYRQLNKKADKQQMNRAHVLGWGVELLRASNALINETMGLRLNHPGAGAVSGGIDTGVVRPAKIKFADKHGLGNKAFNDALLLQNGAHILLKKYFMDDPKYTYYADEFTLSVRSSTVGRLLQFDSHPVHPKGFEGYTYKTYQGLIRHNVSNTSYILPISLALHLACINKPEVHERARRIFEDLGYFSQVNRDYASHYLEGKENGHADIREGRLTYMFALARQRVNADQKEVLDTCYGSSNPEKLSSVLELYRNLNMKKAVKRHIAERQQDIVQSIQQISKLDKLGLSQEFVFDLITSMDKNEIA